MLKRLTIRQRILITFVAIVLMGSISQLIIAGHQLQFATLEFYQHDLETDALITAANLSEPFERYLKGRGTEEIQHLMSTFHGEFGHDYLIVDRDYEIVDFTAGLSYDGLEVAPITPELLFNQDQLGADIRPGPHQEDYLYVATPILYDQFTLGYLTLSIPMAPAYSAVNQQWLQLASASLPIIALAVGAGLWISGTISHPVQQLRSSALKMASGELNTRIQNNRLDEVGQLAQTFNYMAEQIEVLLKTQRNFISNAAHELRTPLMTLKLRAEALEDDNLPAPERAVYISEIHEEIDHMAGLVSSLLALARIDEGRYKSNGPTADPTAVLHDSARHWRIASNHAGLKFTAEIAADLPELPLGSNDLRLILDNLLGNAIKYTSEGTVQLTATPTNHQIVLTIADTGIGFTPEQSTHLFDRFYRSDNVRAQFEGTGLGLSIVYALLKQYGGTIHAHSSGLGQGATFTVTLPLKPQILGTEAP
jgi:signal transduction histidine kinase